MDLEAWVERGGDLAIAVRRGRIEGLLPLRVPPGAFAYRIDDPASRAGAILRAGETLAAGALHYVFPATPRVLEFDLPPLESAEGLRVEAHLALEVRVEPRPVEVRLFLAHVAGDAMNVSAARAAEALADALRDPARRWAASRSVEAMPLGEDRDALAALLRDELGGAFLDLGIELVRVRDGALRAPDYDALRRERVDVRIQEERVRNALRLRELRARLGAGGAAPAGRIAVAAGRSVLLYDAGNLGSHARPCARWLLEDGPFGAVRSVRAERLGPRVWVLAGARRGIYALDPRDPGRRIDRALPRDPAGRGGVNAACLRGGHVYGTHSEVGLVRWPLEGPGRGEVILADATRGASSVRGVAIGPDGRGYLAAGERLLAFLPEEGRLDGTILEVPGDSITAFAVAPEGIVAGTREGRLWWIAPGREPAPWPARAHAVTAVRIAARGGERFAIVAAREPIVWARSLEDGREIAFRCGAPVRWAEAGGGAVFGVDRVGRAIDVWRWDRPEAPERRIPAGDEVRDLAVLPEEEPCASS